VLRWLTRLFRQRDETASVPSAPPPPPATEPAPLTQETPDTIAVELTSAPQPIASAGASGETLAVSDAEPDESVAVDAPSALALDEAKETCPTCGRTSVFAGPPGQRFCTYCALRDELFERSAAASSTE